MNKKKMKIYKNKNNKNYKFRKIIIKKRRKNSSNYIAIKFF